MKVAVSCDRFRNADAHDLPGRPGGGRGGMRLHSLSCVDVSRRLVATDSCGSRARRHVPFRRHGLVRFRRSRRVEAASLEGLQGRRSIPRPMGTCVHRRRGDCSVVWRKIASPSRDPAMRGAVARMNQAADERIGDRRAATVGVPAQDPAGKLQAAQSVPAVAEHHLAWRHLENVRVYFVFDPRSIRSTGIMATTWSASCGGASAWFASGCGSSPTPVGS